MNAFKNTGKALKEKGFEIIQDVLTDEECDTLINDAHSIVEKNRDDVNNFSPIMHPHKIDEENNFFKIMKKKTIINLIQNIIKGPVMGLQSQFFFMPPDTPGFQPHQDDFYVKSQDPEGFVSLWIALTKIKKMNGPLRLWPGSHQKGIFEVRRKEMKEKKEKENTDKNGSELYSVIPKELKDFQELEMNRGTGVLLHSRVLHSSRKNLSKNFRYAILYTFIKEGLRFNPGSNAKRETIKLDSA